MFHESTEYIIIVNTYKRYYYIIIISDAYRKREKGVRAHTNLGNDLFIFFDFKRSFLRYPKYYMVLLERSFSIH